MKTTIKKPCKKKIVARGEIHRINTAGAQKKVAEKKIVARGETYKMENNGRGKPTKRKQRDLWANGKQPQDWSISQYLLRNKITKKEFMENNSHEVKEKIFHKIKANIMRSPTQLKVLLDNHELEKEQYQIIINNKIELIFKDWDKDD